MMPLPVAAGSPPASAPGVEAEAAATSGDFAALLALVGAAPTAAPVENHGPESGGRGPESGDPASTPPTPIAPPSGESPSFPASAVEAVPADSAVVASPAEPGPSGAVTAETAPPGERSVRSAPIDAPPVTAPVVAPPPVTAPVVAPPAVTAPVVAPPAEAAPPAAPPAPPPLGPHVDTQLEETVERPAAVEAGPGRVAAIVAPGPHDTPRAQVAVPLVAIAASPVLAAAAQEETAESTATVPGPVPATAHGRHLPFPTGFAKTSPAGAVSARSAPKAGSAQAQPTAGADSGTPIAAAAPFAPEASGSDPVATTDQPSGRRLPALDERSSAAAAQVVATPGRAEAARTPEIPAAATPATPPAVPDQIVSAVVPLHGRGDGRHDVTLELRPDHLGSIRVEVTVEQQTVHVTLHAADPATGRLLSAALPELRSALGEAGLTTGFVGLGPDGGGGAGARRDPASGDSSDRPPPGPGVGPGETPDHAAARLLRPAPTGRLDLFL